MPDESGCSDKTPECEISRIVLKELTAIREEIAEQKDALMKAFPADDVDGHRRYHELLIEHEQQRIHLRQAIIEKTLSGLIWMGLVFVGTSVWKYVITMVVK